MVCRLGWSILALSLVSSFLLGCSSTPSKDEILLQPGIERSKKTKNYVYATPDIMAQFEAPENAPFRLGTGDKVTLKSMTRSELLTTQYVGPDGKISVPLIGSVMVDSKTREEVEQELDQKLRHYYKLPSMQLTIDDYNSNRVTILGRVEHPGVLRFDTPPTLIEALARAGSLPVLDKQATLARCEIFRGRNAVIWVDLKQILVNGDMRGNIRLRRDDLIYIPDSDDTLVYVMGEVNKPGAYRLTPDMSLLDALAQAGGPSREADASDMTLFRGETPVLQHIPFDPLIKSDPKLNVALREGDVIYVPRSTLSTVGAFLQQISPGVGLLLLYDSATHR